MRILLNNKFSISAQCSNIGVTETGKGELLYTTTELKSALAEEFPELNANTQLVSFES